MLKRYFCTFRTFIQDTFERLVLCTKGSMVQLISLYEMYFSMFCIFVYLIYLEEKNFCSKSIWCVRYFCTFWHLVGKVFLYKNILLYMWYFLFETYFSTFGIFGLKRTFVHLVFLYERYFYTFVIFIRKYFCTKVTFVYL